MPGPGSRARTTGYTSSAMSRDDGAWREHLQSTTRSFPDTHHRLADEGVPGLTILCHPDPHRVGEVASLSGLLAATGEEISRLNPHFVPPGGGTPRPLADPHLSRRPLLLSPLAKGGARLDPHATSSRITIAGTPLTNPYDVERAELDAGVILLLGRVALCLHRLPLLSQRPPNFGLVGESSAMLSLRREIQHLADLDHPVLLRGESGTGKELVARALHQAGARRTRHFVAVNVGAIPPSLAAAELFGTVKGAFTGADRQRLGHFQRAAGGTLFLDEIGDTPIEIQVLLLRALETRQIQSVGAATPTAVDVRLISATDADLEAAIANGKLRLPLFHRLASCELELPPLRDRREDFGRLFFHFLRQELATVAESHRLDHAPEPWVPASVVAQLAAHPWPGNVRQLRNVVRQLVVASRGKTELRIPKKVEKMLLLPTPGREPSQPELAETALAPSPPAAYRHPDEIGESELLQALGEHRWHVQHAADALNLSRTSLYALIRKCPRVRTAADLDREEIAAAMKRCGGQIDAMVDLLEVSKRGLQLRISALGLRGEGGSDDPR